MTTSEERIQAIREETERIYQRIAKLNEQSERRHAAAIEEYDRLRSATRKESERHNAELRKKFEETYQLSKENEKRIAELMTLSTEHGKKIGGFGNKFGKYTESLAQPSIRRILDERFDAHYEGWYSHKSMKFGKLEIDGWGVTRNGVRAVYLVEVKSKFKPKHIQQVWRHVEMFRKIHPEYQNDPMYPILAVVEINKTHRDLIWESGIYLMDVADGVFELAEPPAEFKPRGGHGANGVIQREIPHRLRLVPKVERRKQKEQLRG